MGLDIALYSNVDVGHNEPEKVEWFEANYTHNCNVMAKAAGIYEYVWRPEECNDVQVAGDLIAPLNTGITQMEKNPIKFKALNPTNGWGCYNTFLSWLRAYRNACIRYPKAKICADR